MKQNKLIQDDVIRARINRKVKEEASAVLATVGLTPSDAYRMMMMKIATEKQLPFNPLVPNQETIEAMLAVRAGEVTPLTTVADLFASLDAEDEDDD